LLGPLEFYRSTRVRRRYRYSARQVFWLPLSSGDLPIPLIRNSGHPGPAEFPGNGRQGRVTAAGPPPIHTGFPIKCKHLAELIDHFVNEPRNPVNIYMARGRIGHPMIDKADRIV